MVTIHNFRTGKIIRHATQEEYSRYLNELSKKSKEDQLSGEIEGKIFGIRGMIYMQDFPIGGLKK